MRKPAHPGCPPPAPGVLLPRIIAHEHRCIPRLCAELCLSDLPECICPPLCLQAVTASTQPPSWTLDPHPDGCGRVRMQICIPIFARLCDSSGKIHCISGSVKTCVLLPGMFGCAAQHLVHIEPCVRLLCAEPACSGCFHAQLHATLEIYLLKLQVFTRQACKPSCPQLPLYPPPIC